MVITMTFLSFPIPDELFLNGVQNYLNGKINCAINDPDIVSLRAHLIVLIDLKISQIKPNPPSLWAAHNEDYFDDFNFTNTAGRKNLVEYINNEIDIHKLSKLSNELFYNFQQTLNDHKFDSLLSPKAVNELKSLFNEKGKNSSKKPATS